MAYVVSNDCGFSKGFYWFKNSFFFTYWNYCRKSEIYADLNF